MNWLLTAIVLLPALGAVVLMLAPGRAAKMIAAAFTLATFLLSLWLYFGLVFAGQPFGDVMHPAWYVNEPWINLTLPNNFHFQVNFALGTDGLSMPMIILNGLLSFLAVISSWHVEQRVRFYMAMLLVLETGVMGVFASFDLFLFILFWEVELIPMFLLIGIWGGARREYAAWKFLIYTLVGSSFTLAGILFIYVHTGASTALFSHFAATAPTITGSVPLFGLTLSLPLVLFLLLFAGFAVKIPAWPVHTWLPDAHTEAPTAVSVLLAGVLLKMGAYGLIRVCLGFVPHGAMEIAPILAIGAAINVLWGAGASMVQQDMKKMIAYASVSHMGYVLLGVAGAAAATGAMRTGAPLMTFREAALTGATLQMFTHGLITGMLFFCVGVVYEKAHTRDIDVFGGIAERMPVESTLYTIACLASLGLPALAGFVAEYLVFTGTFALLPIPTIFAAFGVVLTAGYLLWMLRRSFFGPLNRAWAWLTDATPREAFPLVALTLVILFVGIFPMPIVDLLKPSLHNILISAIQPIVAVP
ncbi:MAG TPA: NADH-quinone oxidoreductase subunit M [Ktedonobacterales bacterium]|nr:NADH-quinone oxidoreductase subunit M [Ktedonobacterales bacterium]